MSNGFYRQCPAKYLQHTIQPGDTLYKIAEKYGTSVAGLLSANPGVDPYYLKIGRLICVPVVCPAGYVEYIVKRGDTLYAVAGRHSTTVQAILTANPQVKNPDAIGEGQRLCIPAGIDPVRQLLNGMTLKEKIGQMVMAGVESYAVDEHVRTLINEYNVGGFILFGYNVQSSGQLLALINYLKITNSKRKAPIFVAVDEEGGRVSRMPKNIKDLPSSGAIGAVNNGELSYRVGRVIAEEIKAFGFNMDFAPVLDINSNPDNPVIGDRSFGSNAEVVSKLGVQTMKGIQSGGIISVVKHFPGHGDTSVDSHLGLPQVNHDLNRLKGFELVPFNAAIKNNADGVMIAHILLSKIDPQNPASMSRTIITDLLRGQMKFSGVVFTDDMTMGAIVKNYDIGAAAIKAVNAGADVVLVCRGYRDETAVLDALRNAAAAGAIPVGRIDESVYRILKLKRKYNLADSRKAQLDVNRINSEISKVLDMYNAYR